MTAARRANGQASLELLAGIPALLLAGLVALQLLLVGYSLHLADAAAEAGGLALAAGVPVAPAARSALPGWASERARVVAQGGRVEVSLKPPSALPLLGGALEVRATAWARPAP